ncbi:hypothetical protein LUZ60_010597 [Juncus effusus]|nr:hypothetical protein LUZ60_010597 [Juncus effusus]
MLGSNLVPLSSLEAMLEALTRGDQLNDKPPALPARPITRGRRPASRRFSPPILSIESDSLKIEIKKEHSFNSDSKKEVGFKSGIFGSKRLSQTEGDSPYFRNLEDQIEKNEEFQSPNSPVLSAFSIDDEKMGLTDTIDYVLKKKLRVWCWAPEGKWETGKIQSYSGDSAQILLSNEKVLTVSPEVLLPANPNILDGVDDLIQLSYLNEPSVLHNLRFRFLRDLIYTKAGPILVAMNPFKPVPLYGNNFISAYREKLMDAPHVYAIADSAFNEMMLDGINQSIIISGESGAGKTETAKIAMQYLAFLGGEKGIENEILKTNLILEAFGNAKTSRNDNSSRFGKLIEIHFSSTGKICGAKILTFLLEKSRVVQRASGERSYHVFYQLCAGASPDLKDKLKIKEAENYEYLKKGNCLRINGVDDSTQFQLLKEALDVVKISKEDQMKIFSMLSAVLWLGNISFNVIDNENHVEVVSNEGLINSAKLLGCKVKDLKYSLSTRKIRAGNDQIAQKLTLPQAIDGRDALAKAIYASLFDWLVEQVNKSLQFGSKFQTAKSKSISILDIYGFESFHKNGFEQFCINYANERLQQHFNRHLFKLEQEEYTEDGIDWTNIEFIDNTDCLNLFEKKPLGLFSLLDEESTFPRGTDITFANKLKQHLCSNPCFKSERGGNFGISHYAGEVSYDTSGFLEKNRDPLHSEFISVLQSSQSDFPKSLASILTNSTQSKSNHSRKSTLDAQKQSVGTKFKGQLFKLMQQLESTSPHFIRCIKPNSRHKPGLYDYEIVLQQLRCCGVLEVVRISRAGYPTRLTHQHFAERYGFLLVGSTSSCQDPLSMSVSILQQFNVPPEMYQVGYTKLFFRIGQVAILEECRSRTLQGIIWAQKLFRGIKVRRNYEMLRNGATALQSFVRGEKVRNNFRNTVKRWRAAILIQSHERRRIARSIFGGRQRDIVILQSVIRGRLARKQYLELRQKQLLEHTSGLKKDEVPQIKENGEGGDGKVHSPLIVKELEGRIVKTETKLRVKEEENIMLRSAMRQYENRWLEYEAKMKSMEEAWQKQLVSLQTSLAAAKKSLTNQEAPHVQPSNQYNTSPLIYPHYDSESVMSTPEGTPPFPPNSTPPMEISISPHVGPTGEVVDLVKEFEQRRRAFDDEVGALNAGSGGALNAEVELKRLKDRFNAWKRDYKARLRDAKCALSGNHPKKWWGGMWNAKCTPRSIVQDLCVD